MSVSSTNNNNYDNFKSLINSKLGESNDVSYILKNVISINSESVSPSENNFSSLSLINSNITNLSQELSKLNSEVLMIENEITTLENKKMIILIKVFFLTFMLMI